MDFRLGTEQRVYGPGDVVVIPGGTEHEAWFREDTGGDRFLRASARRAQSAASSRSRPSNELGRSRRKPSHSRSDLLFRRPSIGSAISSSSEESFWATSSASLLYRPQSSSASAGAAGFRPPTKFLRTCDERHKAQPPL